MRAGALRDVSYFTARGVACDGTIFVRLPSIEWCVVHTVQCTALTVELSNAPEMAKPVSAFCLDCCSTIISRGK